MKRTIAVNAAVILLPVCAVLAAGGARAQSAANYPTKPIRVVIGFAPGGPADICGRVVAPRLSELLGQSVVIENRGGAGGTIGMEQVIKAAPDGYTLGLGSSGNLLVAPHLYPKAGYNVQKDLVPVSQFAVTAYAIAVNPSVPAKSVRASANLAYGVPLLACVLGAVLGTQLADDLGGILGALGGLSLAFGYVRSRSRLGNAAGHPYIVSRS